jgi:hypothetical protein
VCERECVWERVCERESVWERECVRERVCERECVRECVRESVREWVIHGCMLGNRTSERSEHEWAQRRSEISCSTREINLVFPSTHVFYCLLYKQNSVKNNKTSVVMRFTTNDIFTRKNIVFFISVAKNYIGYNTYMFI